MANGSGAATIVGVGDSLTFSNQFGLRAEDHALYLLKKGLAAQGVAARERNFGISGNTTAQMFARRATLLAYGVPDLAVLHGGANDRNPALAVQAGATATVVPLAAGAGGFVAAEGYLVIGGETRQIASVATDTVTLGAALPSAPAAGATAWADTRRNLFELGKYLRDAGCPRVVVGGSHYKNWTAGGDTIASEESVYGALRDGQELAAGDIDALAGVEAIYADRYAWMRGLIVSGAVAQGSNTWSAYADNQHLSPAGHKAVAECDLAAIIAKAGWLAALRAAA